MWSGGPQHHQYHEDQNDSPHPQSNQKRPAHPALSSEGIVSCCLTSCVLWLLPQSDQCNCPRPSFWLVTAHCGAHAQRLCGPGGGRQRERRDRGGQKDEGRGGQREGGTGSLREEKSGREKGKDAWREGRRERETQERKREPQGRPRPHPCRAEAPAPELVSKDGLS